MLRFDDAERKLDLSVHDLVEAGPPRGDLTLQVAWTARARMRAGQVAHGAWQAERAADDADFRAEVTVRHSVVVRGWTATVGGRIDGMSVEGGFLVVEEVKSTALPTPRLEGRTAADFGAWARQIQLYLHFLRADPRPVVGRLVIVSLADGGRTVLQVPADPDLERWIHDQLDWIVLQRERRNAWMGRRREAKVPFAHPGWRPGQEALSAEVRELVGRGRHVLLSAPTGYGKTAAVLHAALGLAYATDRRVFFATARTTQQRMVEDTARAMVARGLPVRAVSIRARDRICLNEVVACRPDACRFADGHFDRVREGDLVARLWGEAPVTTPDQVLAVAEEQVVCPYALSLEAAAGADLVVGDLNYLFDPAVRLATVADEPGQWLAVVDEAHNLPDRAMGYGSPEVSLARAEQAAEVLAEAGPAWQPCLEVVEDVAHWLRAGVARIPDDAPEGEMAWPLVDDLGERDGRGLREATLRDLARRFDEQALAYALLKLERPLFEPGSPDPWMDTAYAVLGVRAALERAGPETVVIWRRGRGAGPARGQLGLFGAAPAADPAAGFKLLCRDPSALLGPVMDGLAGSVCMSATLEPAEFFRAMLGVPPERLAVVQRPSPFPPENRRVVVCPQVSTEYRHRARDREATAGLLSEVLEAVPGNVAVYFPSFAFLESIQPLLRTGRRPMLVQGRAMDEVARRRLVETMARGEGHGLLAVLGGIFAEGVDLPGDGLLAAVVVGPALPAATLERRLLQAWFEERYGEGRRYAWLVPGMSRVVQAAGRVVRTPEDRGAVVLVCRRFLQREYQDFFPEDWEPRRATDPASALEGLWNR